MKILTVIGARPQFVKSAVVSLELSKLGIHELILHTGQHFDKNMSDIFFEELGIKIPDYNLGINGGSHGQMTGQMLESIEKILLELNPEALMVYGDTNSTLAGALAAVKLHIPVVHVESGLRSFNRRMPEEINRILTDQVSDTLFAPTQLAYDNLINEGVDFSKIILTGDVMYDAALHFSKRDHQREMRLSKFDIQQKSFILATVHRAENTDNVERLKVIIESLDDISQSTQVVLPLHPRTRNILQKEGILPKRIKIIDPIGYLDMISFLSSASLVVTDSGGVQKEAFFFKVPCVTLRDETEWVELVENNWNVVCPPHSKTKVINTIKERIDRYGNENFNPYGDGNASEIIAEHIYQRFS